MASGKSALPERRGIMYTFHSRVRYSEIDANGHVTLDNIINYMQDCSTFHSEDLGVGIKYLQKNHQVWMLSAWQIVIEQLPKFAQEITIGTQAYDFSNVFGYRNFAIMDETGAYLVKANSIWCLTDTVTGRPMRIKPEFVACYGIAKPLEMNYADRKITIPHNGQKQNPIQVQYYHLDTNQHVNNGQYVKMALQYLPKDFSIYQMRAEYRQQAKLGDIILPVVFPVQLGFVVVLENEDGKPFSIVELLSR